MLADAPCIVLSCSVSLLVSRPPTFSLTLNSLSNISVKVLLIPNVKSSCLSVSVTSSSVFFSSSFKDFQTPVNFMFPRLVTSFSVFVAAVSAFPPYLCEAALILSRVSSASFFVPIKSMIFSVCLENGSSALTNALTIRLSDSVNLSISNDPSRIFWKRFSKSVWN